MAKLPLNQMSAVLAGVAVLSLSAVCAVSAVAQPPAADANEDLLDGLVVTGVKPGPAYWRVQKAGSADSTVWILGIPAGVPKAVDWNTDETRKHLKGANRVILGPDQQIGNVFSLIWIFLTQREKFMAGAPLSQTLPADLYARYEKAAPSNLNRNPQWQNVKPILAALGVAATFNRSLDIDQREPERTVRRMALFRVTTERAGQTVALDFVRLLQSMPRDVELTCMDDALRQVEAGKARALEAAKGWARGDLRVAVSAQRGWDHCIAQDREIAAINEHNIQAATEAIAKALDQPGKAVALVQLRPLLAQRGVIVRLRERGIVVTAPDVPGIEDAEEGAGP